MTISLNDVLEMTALETIDRRRRTIPIWTVTFLEHVDLVNNFRQQAFHHHP